MEYVTAVFVSLPLVVGLILLAVLHVSVKGDPGTRRRLMLVTWTIVGALPLWPPIARALWSFYISDGEYLKTVSHGFTALPSPAEVRASLALKPTVPYMREVIERFSYTNQPEELMEFYQKSLEREATQDYWECKVGSLDCYAVVCVDACEARLKHRVQKPANPVPHAVSVDERGKKKNEC
ncbi:unnamed protein product [Discosporangium mesarthrocarpum]